MPTDNFERGSPLAPGNEPDDIPDASTPAPGPAPPPLPPPATTPQQRSSSSASSSLEPPEYSYPPGPRESRPADSSKEKFPQKKKSESATEEAETQATDDWDSPAWSTFDIGRALAALRSGSDEVRRRTLRRLHVRWWHASGDKMARLLSRAGVGDEVQKMAKAVCNTREICRKWQRPSSKPVAKDRISDKFNEVVQADIRFWNIGGRQCKILRCIDECTRFTQAWLVNSNSSEDLLTALSRGWFKIFQPPSLIICDQEGGLSGDETAVFLERHKVQRKLKATDLHAQMVERHHEILRGLLHKIADQCAAEGIRVTADDILTEAVYAKNAIVTIGGHSPHEAVFVTRPHSLLPDLEEKNISVLGDTTGMEHGVNRHSLRLREIALGAMVQATAQARMQLADRSRTRRTGEQLDLTVGSLCRHLSAP